MALVGMGEVSTTATKSPPQLWRDVNAFAGLTLREYASYFRGAGIACAIGICRVVPLKQPISLEVLRERWPGFQPPQSYRFLSGYEKEQLLPFDPPCVRDVGSSFSTQ